MGRQLSICLELDREDQASRAGLHEGLASPGLLHGNAYFFGVSGDAFGAQHTGKGFAPHPHLPLSGGSSGGGHALGLSSQQGPNLLRIHSSKMVGLFHQPGVAKSPSHPRGMCVPWLGVSDCCS